MATKRQRSTGSWEFIVKNKAMLGKPLYLSFDSEADGDRYCAQLESLLARGVLPADLARTRELGHAKVNSQKFLSHLIKEYLDDASMSSSDRLNLNIQRERVGGTRLGQIDYKWCQQYIAEMKMVRNLTPNTIKHHVGALRRCFDWAMLKGHPELVVNPLRMMPRGFANYSDKETRDLEAAGMQARHNDERDRRLQPGEEDEIRRILGGGVPNEANFPLTLNHQAALECIFELAVESAMRMSEMHTLEVVQVKLKDRTIFLDHTKNGDNRQVPLTTPAVKALKTYIAHVDKGTRGMEEFKFTKGLLFPWWSGERETVGKRKGKPTEESMRKATARLSQTFARIFEGAGCGDLHFHDLRHEATSRLFERTRLTDVQISRITGHKDPRMLRRYANLRASDLAGELW